MFQSRYSSLEQGSVSLALSNDRLCSGCRASIAPTTFLTVRTYVHQVHEKGALEALKRIAMKTISGVIAYSRGLLNQRVHLMVVRLVNKLMASLGTELTD